MTGKPVTQGGIRGRREATGRGLSYALNEVCSYEADMRALGLSPRIEGKRVAVQGLDNVGYHAAKFCREAGAVVIAIAEREGGIRNDRGLNEEECASIARPPGPSCNFRAPRTSR